MTKLCAQIFKNVTHGPSRCSHTSVKMRNTEEFSKNRMTLCKICELPCSNVCITGYMGYGHQSDKLLEAELSWSTSLRYKLLSFVASPEGYLHYICSESKRHTDLYVDSFWRDMKHQLLFSLTLNLSGGMFCNDGAEVAYIPVCKLYLFIYGILVLCLPWLLTGATWCI